MSNFKISLYVALYEFRLIICSVKFCMLSLVSFFIMYMSVADIRDFSRDYGLPTAPAILPFYLSDLSFCNIQYLFLIYLFSDLPLKMRSQNHVFQRSGMLCFGAGQLLAVIFSSFVFVVEQIVFSILVFCPNVTFDGWGKVWGTVSSVTFIELGYSGRIVVADAIIHNYSPFAAVLLSSILFLLTGIIYGFIEFLLNGLSRGRVGTAVLSVWSVLWIFLKTSSSDFVRPLMRFSPQAWNNLAENNIGDIKNIIIMLVVIIAIFFLFNMFFVLKRKLVIV